MKIMFFIVYDAFELQHFAKYDTYYTEIYNNHRNLKLNLLFSDESKSIY